MHTTVADGNDASQNAFNQRIRAVLGAEGPFARLNKQVIGTQLDDWSKQRRDDVMRQIQNLTSAVQSAPEVLVQDVVSTHLYCPNPNVGNALARFCIFFALGNEKAANAIETAARQVYLFNPRMWQELLGDMLPPDFVEANRAKVALKAYQATASTADNDLATYLQYVVPKVNDQHGYYITTSVNALNAALGGGMHGFTIVSGGKGVGKSSLVADAKHVSLHSDPELGIVHMQLDGHKHTLLKRMLCRQMNITYCELEAILKCGSQDAGLEAATVELRPILRRIVTIQSTAEVSQHGLTFDYISSQAAVLRDRGCRKFAVIIDLLNRLDCPPDHREESLQDDYRLDLVKSLGRMNSSHQPQGVPVIAVCEVRKSATGNRNLGSYDEIIGPSRLSSDADLILMLEPDDSGKSVVGVQKLHCHVAKGRDGVRRETIPLWFEHAKTKFHGAVPRGARHCGQGPATDDRQSLSDNLLAGTEIE